MQKEKKEIAINSSLAILPISSVAQALGVHQRTLRIYDKAGILTPKRTNKNRRNYSLDDLERAKAILFLTRNLALNIAGVKMLISAFELNNVRPKDYINQIQKIAKNAEINLEIQKSNIEKTAKRGRKAPKD